jgi:hypothetical protein
MRAVHSTWNCPTVLLRPIKAEMQTGQYQRWRMPAHSQRRHNKRWQQLATAARYNLRARREVLALAVAVYARAAKGPGGKDTTRAGHPA